MLGLAGDTGSELVQPGERNLKTFNKKIKVMLLVPRCEEGDVELLF